jgi:dihydropyrimidinase
VLWDQGVGTGKLTPNEFVRVTSTAAAQIFNVYPRKGAIKVGSDADIVIFDPNASRTISFKTHHQAMDFNLYEGMTVTGIARNTISQGKVVWDGKDLQVEKGVGRYVDRPTFAPVFEAVKTAKALREPRKGRKGGHGPLFFLLAMSNESGSMVSLPGGIAAEHTVRRAALAG